MLTMPHMELSTDPPCVLHLRVGPFVHPVNETAPHPAPRAISAPPSFPSHPLAHQSPSPIPLAPPQTLSALHNPASRNGRLWAKGLPTAQHHAWAHATGSTHPFPTSFLTCRNPTQSTLLSLSLPSRLQYPQWNGITSTSAGNRLITLSMPFPGPPSVLPRAW